MRIVQIMGASVVLLLVSVLSSGTSGSTNVEQVPSSPDQAAIRETLNGLYNLYEKYRAEKNEKRAELLAERVKGLGFETIQELPSIVVGPGFPVFVVQLDELREYQKGTDAQPLLHETRFTLYPVMVRDKKGLQVRSAARVGQGPKGKDPIGEWNHYFFTQPITVFRDDLQRAQQCLELSRCFVIEVPALGRYLFGVRDDTAKTFLVARLDPGSRQQLTSKELREARQVFQELATEATRPGYDLDRDYRPSEKRRLLPNDAVRQESR